MTNTSLVPTKEQMLAIVGGDKNADPQEAVAKGLAAIAAKNNGNRRSYLMFDTKSGILSYKNGEKRVVLDDEAELAVNMLGVTQVLSCWKKEGGQSKVVDKVEVPFHEDLPDVDTLPLHGIDVEECAKDDDCRDGWSESLVVPVRDVASGKEFDFLGPNLTMRNAFGRLMSQLSEEIALHDPMTETPVITVSHTTYKSAHGGHTVYAPRFDIERWATIDELVAETQKALPSKGKK